MIATATDNRIGHW